MRSVRSEHAVLVIMLMVPLVLALLGWPAFVRWAVGPAPSTQATPEVAGAEATSAAVARDSVATARPTVAVPGTLSPPGRPTPQTIAAGAQPTAAPTGVAGAQDTPATPGLDRAAQATAVATADAQASAQAAPVATRVDQAGAQAAAASTSGVPSEAEAGRDPSATVQEFYTLVARHDFTDAANLWSPRMRAAYPPQQNIDGRFSQTQDVTVRQAQVISNPGGGGQAVVAVDLVESTAAGSRRWIGNWYLVRGPGGWLLDQPQLQSP